MAYKKYHRKYLDRKWNYKAISTIIDNREIIYYTLVDKGIKSSGVEIYGGRNYIVPSNANSYSRRYLLSNIPKKYKKVVQKLMIQHRKTKWSTKGYINLN